MKTCKVCGIEKELSEFHRKRNSYQHMCKECRKIYIRQHYLNNKKKYLQHSKESGIRTREKWKKYKSELKCQICEENHPACLEFHHRDPSTKSFCVATSIGLYSWERVLEEVAKCDVLCANCHRKHHHK